MIKLRTPLVIATILAVTALSLVRLFLFPESWASSLAALGFFPIAIGALMIRSRSAAKSDTPAQVSGKLRAALVGAGVLLASSLLFSTTDQLGITAQNEGGSGRSFVVVLAALVAVAIDILSARLEKMAEKDPD